MVHHAARFLRRHFGFKEWAAIGGSLLLIILAVWLSARTSELGEFGYLGGFLAMLIGSATVFLPAPALAVVVGLGAVVSSPLLLGVAAGLGATMGEITGYFAGYGGHKIVEGQKHYRKVKVFIERRGFVAIAVLAFIPNPLFDIAGVIAGSTRYPLVKFLAATLIGKTGKCVLAAYAGSLSLSWFI